MLRQALLIYALSQAPFNPGVHAQIKSPGIHAERIAAAGEHVQVQTALAGDALSIGAVTLRLGMSRDAALSDLSKHYALQRPLPANDVLEDWVIHDKTRADEILGT